MAGAWQAPAPDAAGAAHAHDPPLQTEPGGVLGGPCRLLLLPDHIIIDIGLRLESIGDLHTLLRRTCKRLRAMTTTTSPSHVLGLGGGASGTPHVLASSRSTSVTSGASSCSHDEARAAPPCLGGLEPGGQQGLGGGVAPDVAIKAMWLLRWPAVACGQSEPIARSARAGDADVTLHLLDRLGPTPSLVYDTLCAALTNPSRGRVQHVVRALLRRHGGHVAMLDPRLRGEFLHDAAACGCVPLVALLLDIGSGAGSINGAFDKMFKDLWGSGGADLSVDWGRAGISAGDLVLMRALTNHGAGLKKVAPLLFAAVVAGRATVSPLTELIAAVTIARYYSKGWAERAECVAAMEHLTRMPRAGLGAQQAVGLLGAEVVMGMVCDVAAGVAAVGDGAALGRLLQVLPPLPFRCRAGIAKKAAAAGRCGTLRVLLGPQPRPAGAPAYLGPAPPEEAGAACNALVSALGAAAGRGHTDATLLLLDVACGPEGREVGTTRGRVSGPVTAMAYSGALELAAKGGHGGTVTALLQRARERALVLVPRWLLDDAATAATRAGHEAVAKGLLDRRALARRGERRGSW